MKTNEQETHIIEISTYPQSFTISGMSVSDAVLEAQRRFYAGRDSLGINQLRFVSDTETA